MKTLTQFGFASPKQYYFPANAQISYQDNFAQLVTRSTRIPGAHGGIDELGYGRGLHEIGSIQAEFWLKNLTVSQMTDALDGFLQMADWGKQVLYMQPSDKGEAARWCYARVDDISYAHNVHNTPHKQLKVKVVYQVSDPFWYGAGNQVLWDGTYDFDSTVDWDEASYTSITGSGSFTVTPAGNAFTLGRFVAKVTGVQGFNRLIVRRLVNGEAADEMVYLGPLAQDDVIEFDPRRQWVTLNGVDEFSRFEFHHPDWLRLDPGANTIGVYLDDNAAQVDATVFYFERFS